VSPEHPAGYEPIDIISSIQHVNMMRAPGVSKSPRYLMLRFDQRQTRGDYGLTVKVYYDLNPFPALTATVNQAQLINRIDLSGMCEYMEVQITGPQFPPLVGYEVFWRFRRQIRRTQTWNFALGPPQDDQEGLPVPMRGCRLWHSIDQSIVNYVYTPLNFNTSAFDTDGFHSIVTNPSRITVPLPGRYLIGASAVWDPPVSTSGSERWLGIRLNGTMAIIAENRTLAPVAPGHQPAMHCTTMIEAIAGDYFEVEAMTNNDGTRVVRSWPYQTGGQNGQSPVFWIIYLGP